MSVIYYHPTYFKYKIVKDHNSDIYNDKYDSLKGRIYDGEKKDRITVKRFIYECLRKSIGENGGRDSVKNC